MSQSCSVTAGKFPRSQQVIYGLYPVVVGTEICLDIFSCRHVPLCVRNPTMSRHKPSSQGVDSVRRRLAGKCMRRSKRGPGQRLQIYGREQCWAVLARNLLSVLFPMVDIGCQGSCNVWDFGFFCCCERVVSVPELLPQRAPFLSQAVTERGSASRSLTLQGRGPHLSRLALQGNATVPRRQGCAGPPSGEGRAGGSPVGTAEPRARMKMWGSLSFAGEALGDALCVMG